MIKRFLLFLIVFALLERTCHYLTDGFSILRITSKGSSYVVPQESPNVDVKKALQGSFQYLTSGSQSYVFSSEDDQFVIKFFKHHRWRLPFLLQKIPLPKKLDILREELLSKKNEARQNTFESCETSFKEFREATGLLYIHLAKTEDLLPTITIVDRNHIAHQLPLDRYEFILQRKAEPISNHLQKLYAMEKTEEIKKIIHQFLDFAYERAKKGYMNKDPNFIRNFGMLDGKIVEIDVGGCFHDPKKDLEYFRQYELKKIKRKLDRFIEKEMPDLLEEVHEIIELNKNEVYRS